MVEESDDKRPIYKQKNFPVNEKKWENFRKYCFKNKIEMKNEIERFLDAYQNLE